MFTHWRIFYAACADYYIRPRVFAGWRYVRDHVYNIVSVQQQLRSCVLAWDLYMHAHTHTQTFERVVYVLCLALTHNPPSLARDRRPPDLFPSRRTHSPTKRKFVCVYINARQRPATAKSCCWIKRGRVSLEFCADSVRVCVVYCTLCAVCCAVC